MAEAAARVSAARMLSPAAGAEALWLNKTTQRTAAALGVPGSFDALAGGTAHGETMLQMPCVTGAVEGGFGDLLDGTMTKREHDKYLNELEQGIQLLTPHWTEPSHIRQEPRPGKIRFSFGTDDELSELDSTAPFADAVVAEAAAAPASGAKSPVFRPPCRPLDHSFLKGLTGVRVIGVHDESSESVTRPQPEPHASADKVEIKVPAHRLLRKSLPQPKLQKPGKRRRSKQSSRRGPAPRTSKLSRLSPLSSPRGRQRDKRKSVKPEWLTSPVAAAKAKPAPQPELSKPEPESEPEPVAASPVKPKRKPKPKPKPTPQPKPSIKKAASRRPPVSSSSTDKQKRSTIGMDGHDPSCPACMGRHRAHTCSRGANGFH